ncbi:FtsX-like permease family protein [Acidobacteria bacterium AB60]|nr:FtsX-like permease family protein [Acidobacteria bacterium AB60]
MWIENWLYTLPLRLRSLIRRERLDADLDEELRDHIDRQIEENLARGMSKEQARLAALRTFGNLVSLRGQTHETWSGAWLEQIGQNFRYAIRSARRAPLLSAMAILALALGIGLDTGVFTMLNAMFLRAPTLVDPASFVQLCPRYSGWFTGADQNSAFTTEDFDAIRSHSHALNEVAAQQQYAAFVEEGNKYITTLLATCNYFHVLGIDRPLMGRFFASEECKRSNRAQVAVLSEPLWKHQFGADPRIVGKTIHLNGVPVAVIGVAPSDAANYLLGGVFVPYTLEPQLNRAQDLLASPDTPWLSMIGRLRAGFTRDDARAELMAVMNRQDRAYVERKVSAFNRKTTLAITNGSFIENPNVHNLVLGLMVLMLGPLALILLLACSNVATLFLSRTLARRGEIAIRLAMGVSRSRLAGMLLTESLLTVFIGGTLSMVLAYRVPLLIMNTMAAGQANFVVLLHPDWRVFGYLAILMAAATILSSLMPIRAAWKLDLLTALKGREGAVTVRSRTTSGLIATQIALGFVLVCAAVLFGRIPGLIRSMNPGFEIHQTLAVPVDVNTSGNNRAKAEAFYQALEAKLLATPGVQSMAYASVQPFNQPSPEEIRLPRQAKGTGQPATVDDVSSSFFSAFGIRVLRGRVFLPGEVGSTGTGPVAVVSQAFANQFWPGGDPLGKTIVMPDDHHLTVVGIVADTRSERFGVLDGPRVYTLRSASALGGNLYVRFLGGAKPLETAVRDAVKSLDPTQTIAPQTIWESLEDQADGMTSLAHIILVMTSIALLMAVAGVYGVLSFAVNQRTREFGIKMVLGASRAVVFRSVLLRAIKSIAIGLMCGLAIAEPAMLLFNRLLTRSPFPLHRFDATVFGASAVLLTAVSLIAMYLPAIRAMRTDPIQVLRTE